MRRLEQIRIDLGLTSRDLSRLSGVSEPKISNLRRGRETPPRSSRTLIRLARVLGIPEAEAGTLLDEVREELVA